MKIDEFTIDNNTYQIINLINLDNHIYILYQDKSETLIGELILNGNEAEIKPVNDELIDIVKEQLLNDKI